MGTSIFSIMSKLASEKNAINLSQGFPDFNCSPLLTDLVNKAMKEQRNQYAPMQGILPLRESIAQKTFQLYGAIYNPDTEITITAGATQAIFSAILCCVNPGDEVIIIEPAYDCYAPAILLAGGKVVSVELKYPEYCIDWTEVKNAVNTSTRLIIINTPNNPACSVFSQIDLNSLIEITEGTDILILSDEVYEHIVFGNVPHLSVTRSNELRERSFVVSSFGKSFHVTGWKVGYILAPEKLMVEFRKVHQFNVFSVNTPMQYAINDFLQQPENYMGLGIFYQQKRDCFLEIMKGTPFEPLPCEGTYFQLMSFRKISTLSDKEFAIALTEKAGVACVPLSSFYSKGTDHQVLRFCFAKKEETLKEAGKRLTLFFSNSK